jgi:beta-1,4-mannosyltransferase
VTTPCGKRIWHVPEDGSGKNPYGRLFVEKLRSRGHDVRCLPHRNVFLPDLRTGVPDVVHFQSIEPYLLPAFSPDSVVRALAKGPLFLAQVVFLRLLGVRIVWTVHNLRNHERHLTRFEWFHGLLFSRLAHHLIVHGEEAGRRVNARFRLEQSSGKVATLFHPNFIEAYPAPVERSEARTRLGLDPECRLLLAVGQIRPYKGLPELCRVFSQFDVSGAQLLIAGEAADEDLCREIGIHSGPDIELRKGFLTEEQVCLLLSACDAVVLSYRSILTSGAALLAMSFGRAVVAPRLGCLPEVLGEDDNFLYDPRSDEGLGRALVACATSVDLERMGHANAAAAERLDWSSAVEQIEALYG